MWVKNGLPYFVYIKVRSHSNFSEKCITQIRESIEKLGKMNSRQKPLQIICLAQVVEHLHHGLFTFDAAAVLDSSKIY